MHVHFALQENALHTCVDLHRYDLCFQKTLPSFTLLQEFYPQDITVSGPLQPATADLTPFLCYTRN